MRRIAAAVLFSFCASAGRAGDINWSGAFGAVNLLSSGAEMDGQMVLELGVFVGGFTPTAANTALWAANWWRASLVVYNAKSRHFTGAHQVTSNDAPFAAGTRGYIWGHDGNCTDGEWILLGAASWRWPSQDPFEMPANWTVSTATAVPVGAANGPGFAMKSAKVSAPLPVVTWAGWRAKVFNPAQLADSAISGPNRDPDADGMANLEEFALGGHPLVASIAPGRVIPGHLLSGGRQRLTMAVWKRCDRAVIWSAQASLDLVTWQTGATIVRQNTSEWFEVIENLSVPGNSPVFLRPLIQVP